MALTIHYKKRFKRVNWISGRVYQFRYQSWENDPNPTIIFMYAFSGTHPNTNHEWHFLQGINFSYIPRAHRRAFAKDWIKQFEKNKGDVKLTYRMVKRRYPYLKTAIRRYFYKPVYYIENPKEIPFENMEDAIVSTWSKDYSKKLKKALGRKYKKAMGNSILTRFFKHLRGRRL